MNPRMKKLTLALVQALGAGVAVSLAATPVLAQQTQKIEKIEVTGSNIKRIEGEGALPVTVISREVIQKSGAQNAAELLQNISANVNGYATAAAVGDSGTPGLAAAGLRGLGSTNTLILLNGRRLSNYAFNASGGGTVNLNQIPLAAVERIEVLKDGASAIYGTDAIGGVINFILRKDYTGAEITAYGTTTDQGGGNTRKYTGAIGFGDINKQGFNILATVDYQDDTPLKASQRKQFAGTAIRPDLGFSRTSGNAPPANFIFNGVNYNTAAANGCDPASGSFQINAATGAPQPARLNCRYDFTSVLDIFPPSERLAFFTRGAFQLGKDHQIFGEYHYSNNEITFASSETPVADFTGLAPFFYPAGGRYYPTSFVTPAAAGGQTIRPTGDLTLAGWRAKQGGLRTNLAESEESRFVIGAQGVLAGWDYNGAYTQSRSEVTDTYIDGWFSQQRLSAAIATGNINVFTTAPLDEAGLALLNGAKVLQKVRESEAEVKIFDLRASRDIMELKNGPLSLAAGFEYREEELNDRPDGVLSSGDLQGGGGALPATRASRDITAFFGELNIPILKNLEAQLAMRFDDYSDFGDTTNPKVALRWSPTKQVLVRGSYSTGFRAPSLSDLFLPPFLSNTADNHNDPIRCPNSVPIGTFVNANFECNAQFQNQLGGNPRLKPEESEQYTLGIVFEPTQNLSLAFDFFRIKRTDSIGALGDSTVFDQFGGADPLTANGRFVRGTRTATGACTTDQPGNPTPANIPCGIDFVIQGQDNLGIYDTRGVDVSASFRFPKGAYGQFTLAGEGTYVYQYKYQKEKNGEYFDNEGKFTSDNGAITRWRHYVALNWRSGPWGGTIAQNYVNGYLDASEARRVGSYETYDLQGTWEGWRGLQVTLGVRNVLDRDPPASDQGQFFQVGYDPRYTDPRGRMYYMGLKYAFK